MGLQEGTLERLPGAARECITALERRGAATTLWRERHHALEARYDHVKEEYRLLVYKRFARSAEQIDPLQKELFGEAEVESRTEEDAGEELQIAAHSRKKRGRKPLDENLPRVEILHDIAEEEKCCADSSCAIYSVIETAKQNGLNPYAYLHYLFTQVPTISTDEQWTSLLPANIDAEHVNSAFFATVR